MNNIIHNRTHIGYVPISCHYGKKFRQRHCRFVLYDVKTCLKCVCLCYIDKNLFLSPEKWNSSLRIDSWEKKNFKIDVEDQEIKQYNIWLFTLKKLFWKDVFAGDLVKHLHSGIAKWDSPHKPFLFKICAMLEVTLNLESKYQVGAWFHHLKAGNVGKVT